MVNKQIKQNRMRYSLNKKGDALISFVFSKLAFLIFGVIITASFFFLLDIQKEIQGFDKLARTGESISDITAAVSSSPFPVEVTYEPDFTGTLTVNHTKMVVESDNRNVTVPLYYPLNQNKTLEIDSCVKISKTNKTVISTCQ